MSRMPNETLLDFVFSDGTCFTVQRSDAGDGGWSIHPDTGSEESDFAPIVSGPSIEKNDEWLRPNIRDFQVAEAVWNYGLRGVTLA